jgi:hypothetical protein
LGKEFKPARLAERHFYRYIVGMNWLTKQEQFIICIVIGLLVTGLAVKYYRTAHPATTSRQPVSQP